LNYLQTCTASSLNQTISCCLIHDYKCKSSDKVVCCSNVLHFTPPHSSHLSPNCQRDIGMQELDGDVVIGISHSQSLHQAVHSLCFQ
jgi:hypothetical protein